MAALSLARGRDLDGPLQQPPIHFLFNQPRSEGGLMNPETSYSAKPTSEEAAAPRNFFSRLIGVYFSPGETFVEMSKAPLALAPIIVPTLLFGISSAFLASRGVSWEKIAHMPLVSVTTYAMLAAYIVSTVILVILVFIKPVDDFDWTNPIGSNLAAMFTALGVEVLPNFVKGLLSYVDIFYIWTVALIAIGCAAVSHKLKTSTAKVRAGILACVLALIGGVFAALGGA
jgi:hypothetical protein